MISRNDQQRSFMRLLGELAALYGVLPGYRDARGRWRDSTPTSIYQALEVLGADLDGTSGPTPAGGPGRAEPKVLEAAIRRRAEEIWGRVVQPTVVFWEGLSEGLVLRLPAGGPSRAHLTLSLEEGGERRLRLDLGLLAAGRQDRCGRRVCTTYSVPGRLLGGGRLPLGRHHLRVEYGRTFAEATVICAPRRCWTPECEAKPRWGLFAPVYALRSERDWGAGDLSDLTELADWVGSAGGNAVATLPLLAAYLGEPFEPAPYRPVSRLFWNEFYLAVDRVPEWQGCGPDAEAWASGEATAELSRLRAEPLVDYAGVMRLKRTALEWASRRFFERADDERRRAFLRFLAANPEARSYAVFRARQEEARTDWRGWPSGTGRPESRALCVDPFAVASERERYHLYCQWQMDEQLALLEAGPGSTRPGLLLDLPVGVHPGGFDTWRWPDLFAQEMSVGAPPDVFFAKGQDWSFPPLHPARSREEGHRYYASVMARHMRHAAYLRIDHVMALHRLYWVPEGEQARNGVYVTYPAEELYAVLTLESHRHKTIVVGEDLGTVPAEVRRAMRRHGVFGTWVFQLALRPRAARPVPRIPRHVVAAVNTHDTFPLAGFLRGDDIAARLETGQMDERGARREHAARDKLISRLAQELGRADGTPAAAPEAAGGALLRGALTYLLASNPALVLVNADDLLGETRPQNQPGTAAEQGNWRRRLAADGEGLRLAVQDVGWLFELQQQGR